jgi:predicted N-acyltransferase
MALTIKLLESVREVDQAAWDALGGELETSPFTEWTWLDCLEESGCVGGDVGWLPRHFALFRDDVLIAAAPAYVKASSEGEFVFDWSWAELAHRLRVPYYPKLVVGVPFTPVTGQRLLVLPGENTEELTHLFATAMCKWAAEVGVHGVHVNFSHEGEARAWEGSGFLRRAGFQYHWSRHGAKTFDEFVLRFSSKKRNQIRREVREPARAGIRIETLAPEEITPAIVHAMHAFYATTVDKHYYGSRYLNERFFELVAERFRHRLAWVIARDASGTIVAGAFNVRKGSRLYGRYWGTRVDMPFLHFNVCYYHGIRYCIDHGIDVFEPGAGGEHKRARGFVPTLTHSAHWIESPRLRAILEPHVERERERVEQIVRGDIDDASEE